MRQHGQRWGIGLAVLGGLGAGAALMFLLDPERGPRRRSIARGTADHAVHELKHAARRARRDLEQRALGRVAETRAALQRRRVADETLVLRVRASLGHAIDYAGAIEVSASEGVVRLTGPVLLGDLDRLLSSVRRVRGAHAVDNRLQVHYDPSEVERLRSVLPRVQSQSLLRRSWPATARITMAGAGVALIAHSSKRRGGARVALAAAGTLLLARAAFNRPAGRFLNRQRSRRGLEFHKTVTIHAPLGELFAFWSRIENFPRFMEHLRQVEVLSEAEGRSRWRVSGRARIPFAWEAIVTRRHPDQLLAWRTVPKSLVQHEGTVRFESVDGGTRLDIHVSWRPPAGTLGHLLARLLGVDPKTILDGDMVRLKSLFEQGKATVHGQTVRREELH